MRRGLTLLEILLIVVVFSFISAVSIPRLIRACSGGGDGSSHASDVVQMRKVVSKNKS